ncbi:hypothetical protein R2226_000778 [Cronobacter sakazakii]|nr:hypothetical protein [Cronobacter sakazakii]
MPRYYEIETAFRRAMKIVARGRRTVTTVDFVKEMTVKAGKRMDGCLFDDV